MPTELCDIGVMGLETMGKNLVLNMADHGFRVAAYNRTTSKVDDFLRDEVGGRPIAGARSLEEWIGQLKTPRVVMLMIKSKDQVAALQDRLYPEVGDKAPAEAVIDRLIGLLSPGDVIIDGGNTHYADTERRTKFVESKGLLFVGTGVSGGEEGARHGPSLMPGGSPAAWPLIKPIFQSIAAKVGPANNIPCCEWVGPRGAGHYVKMVHNGIEYGDMQLICEAYAMLQGVLGLSNAELYDVFDEWNRGDLQSYLIEISRDIFSVADQLTGQGEEVDKILDVAGAKGTGKWMSQLALDLGVPSTLVTAAVFARGLSAQKQARVRASHVLRGPAACSMPEVADRGRFIEQVRQALYASKICSYAQGFVQLQEASKEQKWELKLGDCALLWRGGCIIRARFLDRIKEAFDADPNLENLLLAPYFTEAVHKAQAAWRSVVVTATQMGIPVPAFSTALAYYDAYRSARLPANLLQAQRDYFGRHTYQRTDRPAKETFSYAWPELRKPPRD